MVPAEGGFVVMLFFISGLIAAIKMSSDIFRSYVADIKEKEIGLIRLLEELRASKQELECTNRRLNDIIEFIPDPTFVIGQDKRVVAWNRAIELMTGVQKEHIIGKGDYEYALPLFGVRKPILIDLLDIDFSEIDENYVYVKREGEKIVAEAFSEILYDRKGAYLWGVAAPLFDAEGKRFGSIEVIRDISSHKETEDEIRCALKQKEVLIQELYHRTKNNMQIISSMLRLKARRITDPAMKLTLTEIQNKIQSIALVHQKLYDSKNLSEIDLAEYISEIAGMMRSFPGFEERNIKFDLSLSKVVVIIDIAIPCGLVLNELITNSLKYAFVDTPGGTISIQLSSSDSDINLIYADSGKGFPSDYEPDNSSHIGFTIIKEMVTRQLVGDFNVTTDGCFKCEMRIPRTKSVPRV
jgi:PAS domain S-box-containing protein